MALNPVVVVSNRGGVAFRKTEEGALEAKRGGGGLASGLAGVLQDGDTIWISAAMSDADREAASIGADRQHGAQLLDIDAQTYDGYYDTISNETLWFLHHGLFDLAREPAFDAAWRRDWERYREVNAQFANEIAEAAPKGATVLVQDYHLSLVGNSLASLRPDLKTVHFHHTPFAEASAMDLLPRDVAIEFLSGLSAFGACGFHSRRWANCYEESSERLGIKPSTTFVSPLPISPEALLESATSTDVASSVDRFETLVGDSKFLVRVDRIELSKNLIRGFMAFDELLETKPEWVGKVTFGAFCYPSRPNVSAYATYRQDAEALVAQINKKWGTAKWQPILFETDDNYPRSVAALRCADVVLVNPIRDGLNLVAKEAAMVNERNCRVVLSEYAGVFDELESEVLAVNPYDVSQTAQALHEALSMDDAESEARAEKLRALATKRSSSDWLQDQLAAAISPAGEWAARS